MLQLLQLVVTLLAVGTDKFPSPHALFERALGTADGLAMADLWYTVALWASWRLWATAEGLDRGLQRKTQSRRGANQFKRAGGPQRQGGRRYVAVAVWEGMTI